MFNKGVMLNFKAPKNAKETLRQPIWDNDLICIGNKPVQYGAWKRARINHMANLLDNNGSIATPEYLQHKYNLNIKHEYNSLIHSIPRA